MDSFPLGDNPVWGAPAVELYPYVTPIEAPASRYAVDPYRNCFFDNDFSYKQDPSNPWIFGDRVKDMDLRKLAIGKVRILTTETNPELEYVDVRDYYPLEWLPDPTNISFGGEMRFRQMDESNRLRPGLPANPGQPARGDYQLWRLREYVDLKVSDWLRVYAEGIDGSMDNNPLTVTGIDVNRWDVQNLFLDLRIFELYDDVPVWARGGRQELLYGSQRLVSPFDWANIRRNFDGAKLFTFGDNWNFDFWYTRPVNTTTTGDGPISQFVNHFDSPNLNHTFAGAWFTYQGLQDQLFDLYWLWDRNSQKIAPNFAGGNRHTVATRWFGNFPVMSAGQPEFTWHGEVEGGYQFGNDFGKNVSAGFLTAGVGNTWNDFPWTPDLWFYYDWASGSNNLNGKTTNTFSQQYGDEHTYLGLIDNVGRQNIIDFNTKLTFHPLEKFSFQGQFHWFDLANSHDVLYTATGAPLGMPNTGTHVGEECDLLGTWTFNPNFSVTVGYSWFWYGQFVENNAPRGTAEQLYVQTTLRF